MMSHSLRQCELDQVQRVCSQPAHAGTPVPTEAILALEMNPTKGIRFQFLVLVP